MPAITKCAVKGCNFHGNHGFMSSVGGITHFYHTTDDNSVAHHWYSNEIEPNQIPNVKSGTVHQHNGKHFLNTPDQLEAFELTVVPRVLRENKPGNTTWINAYRAELTGHPRKAKRLFKQWEEESYS